MEHRYGAILLANPLVGAPVPGLGDDGPILNRMFLLLALNLLLALAAPPARAAGLSFDSCATFRYAPIDSDDRKLGHRRDGAFSDSGLDTFLGQATLTCGRCTSVRST